MELKCLYVGQRSATVLLEDGGLYETRRPVCLWLNGQLIERATTVVHSLFDLAPDTEYCLRTDEGAELRFTTEKEAYTLNVRRFGAVGDGVHDDTAAIQAAILCCPEKSRVLIPNGRYLVSPLFLKSHLRLEIAKDAVLLMGTERSALPILPGRIERTDENGELYLGSWEGNPLDMYAALFTGVEVEDVVIYGLGTADGQASKENWWKNPKKREGAWRGRLLFLCRCRNVIVQGLHFQNSPAWNLHPYFSQRLSFYNITVTAPADSPNTDGFDPESCRDVTLMGARFSLGDDCIALKAGKLFMGRELKMPCEDVLIAHCLMENGHGGMTVGSEMSGGVRNVTVSKCLMRNTDRGLRIKTRRGRGKDGVIDNILFEDVRMESVQAPCTVNAMYFCDPDGHSQAVQNREAQPVDEGTPKIGSIVFRRVEAMDCGACAAYFLGLPEQPVEEFRMEDVTFRFAPDAKPMRAIMADGVEPCQGRGIIVSNVKRLVCHGVTLIGHAGETLETEQVEQLEWRD
ncbi:MAG: glycoside hydrolase family 28 protein [Eubacteriales bacterium]|nr:glycoside hydrolase family 28 protein [Eubacteriales bacterium]